MKLIIDIDEDVYKLFTGNGQGMKVVKFNLENALKNGTPLPKGHGRLIDADALINKCAYDLDNNFVIDLIDIREAQTIVEADKGE